MAGTEVLLCSECRKRLAPETVDVLMARGIAKCGHCGVTLGAFREHDGMPIGGKG